MRRNDWLVPAFVLALITKWVPGWWGLPILAVGAALVLWATFAPRGQNEEPAEPDWRDGPAGVAVALLLFGVLAVPIPTARRMSPTETWVAIAALTAFAVWYVWPNLLHLFQRVFHRNQVSL